MSELIRETKDGFVRMMRTSEGIFEVWAGEEVRIRTHLRFIADEHFSEARNERSGAAQAKAARERSHYEMQAVRSDSFARRAANARKKGGPGGRGGV